MKIKKLVDCELNKMYLIYSVKIENEGVFNHLSNLFIKKGEKIQVMFKSYNGNAFIVKVLGINYALEKNICEKINVYD